MSGSRAVALELIKSECAQLLCQALRLRLDDGEISAGYLSRLSARGLRRQYDFGPKRGHHGGALGRVAGRHHRDEGIAHHGAHDRSPRASASRRQLDHRPARRQLPGRARVLKDAPRDPILLRQARREKLDLRKDAAVDPPRQSIERDEGRLADRLDNRRADVGAAPHSTARG